MSEIKFPNSITKIGEESCRGYGSLVSIEIPNSVTEIGGYAFRDCTSLTSVNISDGVTTLDGTFSGCTSLTSVNIPDGVTTLDGTFSGCTSLTSIEIPNSVMEISFAAFKDAGLKEIHIKNPTPPDVDDNAFSTYAYVTLYVPVGSKSAYLQHEIWGKFGNIVEE